MDRKNNSDMIGHIRVRLQNEARPEFKKQATRFFKTGPGEYGEGDIFRGIRVPVLRKLAAEFQSCSHHDTVTLLHSKYHEDRLLALLMMVRKYKSGDEDEKAAICQIYLGHTRYVNNWDLVDTSAPYILGPHVFDHDRNELDRLAMSSCLWERRIAIMATYYFIRQNRFDETLRLASALVHDREDLIHKAVGWMLREVGNRNRSVAEAFLRQHLAHMPRTMLRYAIERYPSSLRKHYLALP